MSILIGLADIGGKRNLSRGSIEKKEKMSSKKAVQTRATKISNLAGIQLVVSIYKQTDIKERQIAQTAHSADIAIGID